MIKLLYKSVFVFLMLITIAVNAQIYNNDSLMAVVLQSVNADSIERNIQDLEDFNTRFALAGNQKDIALYLSGRFESMGYTDVKLDSFFLDSVAWPYGSQNYYSTWQYNVVAEEAGLINSNKIYILGAHYDAIVNPGDAFTYSPGADDNATGVAAVLETARVFKLHNIQPAHTIRYLCFAAEELYLRGSDNYATKVQNANENIALMINNDMIGRNLQAANALKFKIQKYPNTDWIELQIQEIAENYTPLTPVVATNSIEYSDSYPFYLRGYDAVFLQEYDFSTHFHTVSDIIDSLDMAYSAEVVKISCGLLLLNNFINTNISENTEDGINNIEIYPNPCRDKTYLKVDAMMDETIDISIFNGNAQKLSERKIDIEKGRHFLPLDVKDLPDGIYYCRIKTRKNNYMIKIIVL